MTYEEVREAKTLSFLECRSKPPPIQHVRVQEKIEKNQHEVIATLV